jgi:beta-galactosidase
MKRLIAAMVVVVAAQMVWAERKVTCYNAGWAFSYDKQTWRTVTVPHDWGVESPFNPRGDGNTGKLPWQGVGYYRKVLQMPAEPKGRRVFLDFDGIMCDGSVSVNGQVCGRRLYGYLGLRVDVTPYLRPGKNEILVTADTTKLQSRWYPGAGMYRRVRLIETDDVYVDERDVAVTTPEVSAERAVLRVCGEVSSRRLSDADVVVTARLKDPDGQTVATGTVPVTVAKCATGTFDLSFTVDRPRLWELKPNAALYTLDLTVRGKGVDDSLSLRTGFRSFRFDPENGFILNGRREQLKGVCLHADLGILGMAYNRSAMRRQLTIMRDMGVNALRTSHNPPSPETLELCDEMGIFVWDECFDKWNATTGRGDAPLESFVEETLKDFVRRDRNHPCVFVWSIGNEIPPGGGYAPGQAIWNMPKELGTTAERCTRFRHAVRTVDATRPVGIGSCFPAAAARGDYANLDISGWNYKAQYRAMRKAKPSQPLLYSESASTFSSYGFYAETPPTNKTDYAVSALSVDSYDHNAAPWSDIPDREFEYMERDRFVGGEFVWTGIDYLGEPSPYVNNGVNGSNVKLEPEQNARSSFFGVYDLLVFPKDRAYLYRSYWNKEAFTLHIVPDHWTFPERAGRKMPVYVYTSADEAELFVNGVSQGRRRKDPSATMDNGYYAGMPRYRLIWQDVAWQPGEVKAVAYGKNGERLGEEILRTAEEAKSVVLAPESDTLPAKSDELVFVKVTLADANGTPVPRDNRYIAFKLEGPGEIVSVGNSNPHGLDSFKNVDTHPLCNGRAGLAVRRTGAGAVTLTAAANGLTPAVVRFK